MPIKVILMDIGGVVFQNTAHEGDFGELARHFAKTVGVRAEVFDEVRKQHLHDSMIGKFSAKEYFDEVAKVSGVQLPENVQELWVDLAVPGIKINQSLLDWIDQVRNKTKVVVFSTISSLRLGIDQKIGIYKHFDRTILSLDAGMTKSDPKFFQYALEQCGVAADEALLIDDHESNIERAAALGIHAVLFKQDYFEHFDQFLSQLSQFDLPA